MHKHMDRTHVAWRDACTYNTRTKRTHTSLLIPHRFHRVSPFFSPVSSFLSLVPPLPSGPSDQRRLSASLSSFSLLLLLSPPFLSPQLDGEHSLANLPYTFVCLNWVAFYTRAWSVNRILNYYSDCVLPGAPISPGSLLVHLRPLFIPRSNISYSLRVFAGRRVKLLSASSLLNSCIQLVRELWTHTGNRVPD